jgi:hypothetical protein
VEVHEVEEAVHPLQNRAEEDGTEGGREQRREREGDRRRGEGARNSWGFSFFFGSVSLFFLFFQRTTRTDATNDDDSKIEE